LIELGGYYSADNRCQFRVWAPRASCVELRVVGAKEQIRPLEISGGGYFHVQVDNISPGTLYLYRLDGSKDRSTDERWAGGGSQLPPMLDVVRAVTLSTLVETMRIEKVAIDGSTMEFAFRRNLERMASRLAERPTDLSLLRNLDNAASLFAKLPFAVDKWQVQNEYYNLLKNTFPKMRYEKGRRGELAQAWTESFLSLGRKIGVHVGEASPVKRQLGCLAEGHNADSDGDLSSAVS
jgi:hypothetical protein